MTDAPNKDGVVAVLEDSGGRMLFIRRGLTLPRAPGYWCFVGGEVEAGEDFRQAIVREMQEEVGLRIEPLKKIHESISPNGEYRLHWIRVRLSDDQQKMVLHAIEVAEARWLSTAEALQLDPMLPTLRLWLERRNAE